MTKLKNIIKYFFLFLILLFVVPLFAFILMWILTLLLWLTQLAVADLGYTVEIAENIRTAVVTFCGALCVAAFALYGVRTQNLSAEKRHRTDKDLELRKNICMEVAEAYAMQQQYLLKLSSSGFDPKELLNDLQTHTKAFFKMHLVCTEKTIDKMLEANEEWARLFCEIPEHFRHNDLDDIDKLIYIQERSGSFLKKVADFNVVARGDLEIPFGKEKEYLDIVSRSYKKIPSLLEALKKSRT